ncbi:hypothetical protein HanXRQr2_Chr06g0250881 [Helianthus annuus]|uniref:Uncharacterized protein n=1 Tax=Helianthus annuus TaxID=4232 RepID=A0A9K3IRQ6_HELAN|nr:hypothetical protein HanXRQr2_Chr06g0250881 [Helianthus annuus]KAJ0559947.1 hypothetical protein HanHA300_Chr06g0206091 [Helianthus annuus]KAJ0566101.1 hypothetical protein HanIR_Chr06g0270031 [Helianthus annuus]KAJ0572932.1 hypothetical protein HanHA89_Chr06g0221211 [Helianthus annuus]KAJ0737369.1 hypothetical protein HanLR1_Chr06g0206261 [Helianthus annuus]
MVTSFAVMDPNNNVPWLFKLIEDYDPIFFLKYRMILQPFCGQNNFHMVLECEDGGMVRQNAFTDGLSKLIEDLALDTRSTLLFTSLGYKTFEVSVFNHETGTEIYFKKVEVVVLDDSIYGDEGFDLMIASEHKEKLKTNKSHVDEGVAGDSDTDDSKFDRHIAALIEMEDDKKLVTLYVQIINRFCYVY